MRERDHIRAKNIDAGLDAFLEYRTVKPPSGEPGYSENDALWVWDQDHSAGLITWLGHSGNVYPQGVERVTVFLPDGALLVHSEVGEQVTEESPSGPGLVVQCEEPFRRWTYRYSGLAKRTTQAELRDGPMADGRESVAISVEATATMLAPPWVQGAFFESREEWRATPAAHFHGGYRYEQLLHTDVSIRIDGGDGGSYDLSCTGTRTHRKGTRTLGNTPDGTDLYPGHIWMDVIFPSGRALYVMQHCGADGKPLDGADAWVREGDTFYRAELRRPPIFRPTLAGEEHLSFALESELGVVEIEGELVANCINTMGLEPPSGWGVSWDAKEPALLALSQGLSLIHI